jgi:hypothetical protein
VNSALWAEQVIGAMTKRKKLDNEVGAFLKQYGRKKQAGHNSNDRQYDRKIENKI